MRSPIKNKGGRPATGRFRSKKFGLELSSDEREYLSRIVYALRQLGEDISQNGFIVKSTFRGPWQEELAELRLKQRGISRKLLWVPK